MRDSTRYGPAASTVRTADSVCGIDRSVSPAITEFGERQLILENPQTLEVPNRLSPFPAGSLMWAFKDSEEWLGFFRVRRLVQTPTAEAAHGELVIERIGSTDLMRNVRSAMTQSVRCFPTPTTSGTMPP